MRRYPAWLVWLLVFIFTTVPVLPVQAATPTVSSVSPGIVSAGGGDIVIYGSNLGDPGTKVVLQIGAETVIVPDDGGAIRLTTANMLIVTVPAHGVDITGIKQVNSLVVSHTTGTSVPYLNPFRYMATPSITHSYPFTVVSRYDSSGNPSQAEADKKTYLKIEGGYLDWVDKVYLKEKDTPDGSAFKFGNFPNPAGEIYRDSTDGGIYIEVSTLLRGREVQVKVENSGGYASEWVDSVYYNVPLPYVTTFYPSPNPIFAGSTLTINGANFLNGDPLKTKVYVAGTQVVPEAVYDGMIKLTVPSPQPGNRDLKIEVWSTDGTRRQGSAIYKNAVDVRIKPAGIKVEQVLPNHGPVAGGNTVIVVGEKFDQTMTVAFEINGHALVAPVCNSITPPPYLSPEKTAFQVTVPASYGGAQGAAVVKIVDRNNPQVVYTQQPNLYFYSTAAQYLNVESIAPTSAPFDQPTRIQLQGQYFTYFRKAESTKYVRGEDGSLTVIGDVYDIPASPGVTRLKLVEDIPSYYDGHDFRITRTVTVTMGGIPAVIQGIKTVGNIQYLDADTGSYPLGDKPSEQVNVVVSINEETEYWDAATNQWVACVDQTFYPLNEADTLTNAFCFMRSYPAPEIISVTPAWGPNLSPAEVAIEGYNFYAGVTVTFGGRAATVLAIEHGPFDPGKGPRLTLRVKAPVSEQKGEVPVVVTNIDGKSATGNYTYVSSPAIRDISPNVGPKTGGNYITISGECFMYGAGVLIGNTLICKDENSGVLAALQEADFQATLPAVSSVVYDSFRVIGPDGVELEDYNRNPDGVKIVLKVPAAAVAGSKEVTVINPDRGVARLVNGYEYKPVGGPVPVITGIQPQEGSVAGGEEVVITGSGFLEKAYSQSTGYGVMVTIDGAPATVTGITDANQKITIITPPGTRVDEWVPVQVINVSPDGVGMAEKSLPGEGFRYHRVLTLPVITGFTPRHGQAGTMVTVFGHDLAVSDQTRVIFGTVELGSTQGVLVADSTRLVFPVPGQDAEGRPLAPGPYELKVKNPDTGTATAAEKFTLQIPSSRPRIEDVDGDGVAIKPAQGSSLGGTDIVVEGYDLHQGLELYIGGQLATNIRVQLVKFENGVWTQCVIRAKTPALARGQAPGPVDVLVVNPDGGSARAAGAFTYKTPASSPVITSVEPNKGPSAGNQDVWINGDDFRVARDGSNQIIAWPVVTFGGYEAMVIKDDTITRSQGKQLRVKTPAYPGGGAVEVTITNPDPYNGSFTLGKGYTYEASRPTITAVTPNRFARSHASFGTITGAQFVLPRTEPDPVHPGQTVTIPGTDVLLSDASGSVFTSLAGQTTMEGTVYENVYVIDDTQIRVIIPPAERVGPRTLRVKNPDGGQADYTIEYISPVVEPTITSIDPSEGSCQGGTNVAITGTNFRDQVEVYFGTQPATVLEKSATRLVVRTPAYTLPRAVDSVAVNVTVTNTADYGSVTMMNGFTYRRVESQPIIKAITPDKGSTQGGTTVVIDGDNFRSGCRVFFGTVEATSVTYNSYNKLTVLTPPHAKGAVDVAVRNPAPDYAEAIKPNGFTFEETVSPVPTDFDGILWNRRAIKLFWTASSVPGNYEIYVSTSSSEASREYLGSTDKTEYMFEDIEGGRRYYFWMRTVNQHGASNFVACRTFPIYVSAEDVTNRPPTARIDANNSQVNQNGKVLNIVVGRDIVFWRYPYYDITLDAAQRACTEIEILIPGEGLEKNPSTTIRVAGNRFRLHIPLGVLNTFEYQEFRRIVPEAYVHLRLSPVASGYLESVGANQPGRSIAGGFQVEAGLQSDTGNAEVNFFAGAVRVAWPASRTALTGATAYYYDRSSLTWQQATSYSDGVSGMVDVSVNRPDVYMIFQ
ncbi:MAG: hypothetical protein GXX09_01345 [Syntrophomonadaceae bacterium]|nr:hypothetical protein [Syntrophomonadaceae bacterium]